jgi:hypothetical protein
MDSDTALFAVYSAAHELDRKEVERLSIMRRVTPIAVSGPDTHNVVKTLFDEGKLPAFYDFIFELSDQPTWPPA